MRGLGLMGAAVAGLVGCADIQLHPASTRDEVLSSRLEERPVKDEVAPKLLQNDGKVTITALQVCETFNVKEIRRTSTRERYNASSGKTWTFGIAGVAATGAGIGMMIDSGSVHPNDETSRTYNPTGKGPALGYGAAITATGVALTTIAIVDAVRASGREVVVLNVEEDGVPKDKGGCLGRPASGVEVHIASQGSMGADKVLAGTTDASGSFSLDIGSAIPGSYRWDKKVVDVWVQGQMVGQVDATKVFQEREHAAWAALNKNKCEEPKVSSDCADVEAYLKQYPGGANQMDAEALLKGSEERLERLVDDEAWAAIPFEARGECVKFSSQENDPEKCGDFLSYLDARPDGRHSKEAKEVLKDAAIGVANREAIAARKERERMAAIEAAEKKRAAAEKRQCLAQCNIGCSGHTVSDKAMCSSGCQLRCSGNPCEASCAIGCSSWKMDNHRSCFSNCKVAQCTEGF